MNWLRKLMPSRVDTNNGKAKRSIPEGVWTSCSGCGAVLYGVELERNLRVCPKCDHHMRLGARERLDCFLDTEPRLEIGGTVEPIDFLKFRDSKRYKDRLAKAQKATHEKDALVVIQGRLKGLPVVAAAFEFKFMGGSMGSVLGERFVRGVDTAIKSESAFVCFSASGGARMQEALMSLMQMGKTSVALARLRSHGLPFISVLTDPTTGGVVASLSMLGDINIAEPKAHIGFAGPRVISDTLGETLPEGFQRSEFLLEHGALDQIMDRREMRDRVARMIAILMRHSAA